MKIRGQGSGVASWVRDSEKGLRALGQRVSDFHRRFQIWVLQGGFRSWYLGLTAFSELGMRFSAYELGLRSLSHKTLQSLPPRP